MTQNGLIFLCCLAEILKTKRGLPCVPVFHRHTVIFLHGQQIANINIYQPPIVWFLQPSPIVCVAHHQFCACAALSLILSCNNAHWVLFSDEFFCLHLNIKARGRNKKDSALCQTVDIFTGCLHSAKSYFKTVVSEEPNACYFCCLLLHVVDSLSLSSILFYILFCLYTAFAGACWCVLWISCPS